MKKTTDFAETLREALPTIDRVLADRDIALKERPLIAAIEFVTHFVIAIKEGTAQKKKPGESSDFVATPWFARLYGQVDEWYNKQYPGAMAKENDDRIFGIVMFAGTVFGIRIPAVRRKPGHPGKTVKISFPDRLRADEDVLDWIDTPPDFTLLSKKDLREGQGCATETANNLRLISTGLMAVSSGDDQLNGFKAGVMPRLHRAADLLLDPHTDSIQPAYWELQLACEMALKALLQQRTGAIRQTHDLFTLYDAVPSPAPAFQRDLLRNLPRWEEAAHLRYGQGQRTNRAECVGSYRAALAIVAGTIQSMDKFGIGDASFEIAQPPWMAELQ